MADASTLRQYFHLEEDENVITRRHFLSLSGEIGMSAEELEIIFTALDTDENDAITLEELLCHWNASNASSSSSSGTTANTTTNNNEEQSEITPVNSPIDSEFESSFTIDESYNGGEPGSHCCTPSPSPSHSRSHSPSYARRRDDTTTTTEQSSFYNNNSNCYYSSPPLSPLNNDINRINGVNGYDDNDGYNDFDYYHPSWQRNSNNNYYSNPRNNIVGESTNHSPTYKNTRSSKTLVNGFLNSDERDDEMDAVPESTWISSPLHLKRRHRLLLSRRKTSTPTSSSLSDSDFQPPIESERSQTPVNVDTGDSSTIPYNYNYFDTTLNTDNSSSSSISHRHPNVASHTHHTHRNPSHCSASTPIHNGVNNDAHSHRNTKDSRLNSPPATRHHSGCKEICSRNGLVHYNSSNEKSSQHNKYNTIMTLPNCDQSSTSFRVVRQQNKDIETSINTNDGYYPSQSHKTNSITEEDGNMEWNRENLIRSPITLELGPRSRRGSDSISERSSAFLNETIFEYDSPKLRGKSSDLHSALKQSRRRSLQNETVYVSHDVSRGSEIGIADLHVNLDLLSKESQEQVCELYQNLHGASNPELVAQFENILLNVIKDVRQYKMENERLEKTYRKEKDEHDRHLRHMEDEMEQQVQNIEHRVRRQEKERLESEKVDLRIQLDSEISMLQQNLKKLQQEGMNKMDNEQEEHILSMKKRLEEIQMQNRVLKSELTDAQTNLALVKTEMTTVKQKLDERTYELDVLIQSEQLHKTEMDTLQFQLQGLHEANKNLLDTNDNLREMLDTPPNGHTPYKRTTSTDSGASARSTSPLPPRKGSVMSDYVDAMSPGNRPLLQTSSFQNEVGGMIPQFMAMNHRFESCEEDSIAEELDSGHSTLRDVNELNDDTECDSASIRSDLRRGRKHRRVKANLRVPLEEEDESHDEMELESEGEEMTSPDPDMFRKSSPNHYRSPSVGSRGSNRSNRSLTREESLLSQTSRSSRGSSRRQLPAVPKALNATTVKITKEPDRVYKIVLAGDAAVGKSSFIVRLCKGKFVPNLSSTLGVDFQTKMLDVDGNTTALQLWDTAGQERFRSVARTYFRRADGVLLLYDVTYERSFLNIRDWVDAIEENAVKKIPIMLVGNKTDARLELEQSGRKVVKYEDGMRLSKEISAHFIESSAKDGSNIHEAVIELTRALRTNEDLEVQAVGLTLTNTKDKKSSSCCGKS